MENLFTERLESPQEEEFPAALRNRLCRRLAVGSTNFLIVSQLCVDTASHGALRVDSCTGLRKQQLVHSDMLNSLADL